MSELQDAPESNTGRGDSLPGVLRGQQVGSYRLLERLGGGAMAAVYRAVDQRDQRIVALKVLLPDADATMRARFRQEAHTHSLLIHPNIVPIYDLDQASDAGLTYIAMELIEGPDLSKVIEQSPRLQPSDAALLLAPIARALDYSHGQGVVHRDVKPSNVLLRQVSDDAPASVRGERPGLFCRASAFRLRYCAGAGCT